MQRRAMRPIWLGVGIGSVALGALGIVLPLLPTTPFLLLAAFAFARSSPRLGRWLLDHPRFGAPIRDWQRDGSIARRTKRVAVLVIAATLVVSIGAGVPGWVVAVQVPVLAMVTAFILTRPDPPQDRAGSDA